MRYRVSNRKPLFRPARYVILAAALLAVVVPVPAQDQGLVVYPSYRPMWNADSETFSLKSTVYILNTGDEELRDLVFHQEVPERMGLSLVELSEEESARQPDGFEESIEAQIYQMHLAVLRPQEGTMLQNHLTLERRLGQRLFPGILVEYEQGGERAEVRLPEETYDLTIYSDHVGSLERFLKKQAKISLDLTSGARKIWEFSGQDASASGSNPTGILGVDRNNERRGYYRLRSGSPGDLVEVLVVWNPIRKRDRRETDPKVLVKRLESYLKWVGNYRFDRDTLRMTKKTISDYQDSYDLRGRWVDQVANRLGEGPFRWIVMYAPRVEVEYHVLFMAQARGLGAEDSKTPQPEREAVLVAELEGYAATFHSSIVPKSY